MMHSGSNAYDTARSLFGGCGRLLLQYRTIGSALKAYEHRCWPFRFSHGEYTAERDLKLSLSYVPVEVLESYLEDLVDLDLGEERLFIEQAGVQLTFPHLAIIATAFCLLGGIIAVAAQASPLFSTLIGCTLAIPIFAFCLTRHQATRRMRFANVLSDEINDRRGNGKEDRRDNRTTKIHRFGRFSEPTPVH